VFYLFGCLVICLFVALLLCSFVHSDFLFLLFRPGGLPGQPPQPGQPGYIQVSPEEKEAIERVSVFFLIVFMFVS
jgi:hypothetical protein